MKWRDACLKSKVSVAIRKTERYIYYRFLNGFSFCESKKWGVRRTSRKSEVEGFLNWEPF